jgi:hypothetical protein
MPPVMEKLRRSGASRFLIGLVTCFSRHDGIPFDM